MAKLFPFNKLISAVFGLPLLIFFALSLGAASTAQAVQINCSDPPYNGVIDGDLYPVFPDNVLHTGQMSCNAVAGHKIWFVNGSSSAIQEGCQNYLIPVDRIDERNPASQTAAAIGVPSKYTVTRTFYNTGSLVTFDSFSIVPAGEEIIPEITAVLDDPSANSPSTQFVNTAKWDFGT